MNLKKTHRNDFRGGIYRGIGIGLGAALAFFTTALLAVTISGTISTDEIVQGRTVSAQVLKDNFTAISNTLTGLPDCTEASAAVRHTGVQSLTNIVAAQLTTVTEAHDVGGLHAPGTPGTFTIVNPGRYSVSAFVYFEPNPTGTRFAQILHNGGTTVSAMEVPAAGGSAATQLSLSGIVNAAAGDTLVLMAQQGSGGNLQVQQVIFSIFRICGN